MNTPRLVTLAALALCLPPEAGAEVRLCDPNLCNGSTVISHLHAGGSNPRRAVYGFRVTADGQRAVYVSNSECRRELYSVATAVPPAVPQVGAPVKLSDLSTSVLEPCYLNVTDEFSITPDGRFAVWEADRDRDQDYEIYSTPIAGGATLQLNFPMPFDNDVERHLVSCDSSTVVFRQGKDSTNRWELYAAAIRGPQPGRRISQLMQMSQAVGAFQVRCDGMVWYMADTSQSGNYEPWIVHISGVPLPVREFGTEELIFKDGFESRGTGAWR